MSATLRMPSVWAERFVPFGEFSEFASVRGTFSLAAIYRNVPSFDPS